MLFSGSMLRKDFLHNQDYIDNLDSDSVLHK